MKRFYIGIRAKLLLSFLAVLGLMIAVGYFSLKRLDGMNAVVDHLNGDVVEGLDRFGEVRDTAHRIELEMLAATGSTAKPEIAAFEKAVQEQKMKVEAAIVEEERSALDDQERATIAPVRKAWDAYIASVAPVFDLIRAKKTATARGLVLSPKGEELDKALDDVIKFHEKMSDDAEKTSERVMTESRSWIVTALGVASGVGLLLAIVIATSVARAATSMQRAVEKAAEGDLTARAEVRGSDEIGRAGYSLNAFLQSLHDSIVEVHAASAQIAAASQELASSAEHLSSGAQEQASSLEETAASLHEITATTKHSAQSAQQAAVEAIGSREVAERGGAVVESAVSAMGTIHETSTRIGEIIGVIDEIAFQTNLLALNAAVEAARAGEQGRGFAVVAGEVQRLAQRSATAAKEIKTLIHDSLAKVDQGSELVNASGATLREIVGAVKRVSTFVEEIAAAGAEQASGVEQVNLAVTQMDQVVQSAAAQNEQLSATAEELAGQAASLRRLVERFKLASTAQPQAVQKASPTLPAQGQFAAAAPSIRRPGRVSQHRAPAVLPPMPERPSKRPDAPQPSVAPSADAMFS